MTAAVGDRIVVASTRVDGPVREGDVLRTGPAGGPPYRVRWRDTGHETVFFPGPGTHVEHGDGTGVGPATPTAPATTGSTVWRVDVHLYEEDGETSAQAVLHADAHGPVRSRATARRSPADPEVPLVGEEVAAAHALHRLGDHLLGLAAQDLATATGQHPDGA